MFGSIANELKESALSSPSRYIETYIDHEQAIVDKVLNFHGIKSEFYCYEVEELAPAVRFLSIFSDFTSVFTLSSRKNEYKYYAFADNHPRIQGMQLTLTGKYVQSSLNTRLPIIPGYLYKNDEDTIRLMQTLDPFLEQGQFLLRPMRTLMVKISDIVAKDNVNYDVYHASSDTPINHWQVKEINEKDSFVIDNGLKPFQSKTLLDLTVPYFRDIPLATLQKILSEEQDLLGKFRVTLKELVKEAIDGNPNINEIRNDKIRPEIETIQRKFNFIKNTHKLSVGATVSAFTLSLIGITAGNANYQTLFNTALGSSTIGFLATEYRYQSEVDKLKDNPYFLLWRINKDNK